MRRRSRDTEHLIDHLVGQVSHGRLERSLSGLTAAAAVVTGAEVHLHPPRPKANRAR